MSDLLFNQYHDQAARDRLIKLAKSHTSPKEVIEAIVKSALGETIKDLRQIIQGEDNEVYDVTTSSGATCVLRISHKAIDTYAIESWAIESIRKMGVPGPEIITSGTYQDGPKTLRYMIQKKVPGTTLDHLLWVDHIEPARAKRITETAGELLGRIHQIQTEGWGDFTQPGKTEFATLEQRWDSLTTHEAAFAEILKPYKQPGLPPIADILSFMKQGYMLSTGKQCLVQNDFAPKHLFIDDHDNIVGVIDFEDVQSADPVQDLAEWEFWFEDSVPVAWLKAGHERVQSLGSNYEARLRALRIERALWLLHDFASKTAAGEWGEKAVQCIKHEMQPQV